MEYRKELSEKSKKLIEKQFKSDILNKSTGYYKKENIYPITSKPNELKIKLKEFIPHFEEVKAVDRYFNNLLSDKQRNNSFIIKNKNINKNKDEELEIKRKRAKTIKDNCYDKKGNFSSKKRYFFEFYGINNLNNLNNTLEYNNNINTIKNDEEENINKEKEINNYNTNININKNSINKFRKNRNKIKGKLLKSRNMEINRGENFCIESNYCEEKYYTVNNDNEINDSFFNDNNKNIFENKIKNNTRNKNWINNDIFQNTFNNTNNKSKIFNRIKTDIHYPGMYLNNTISDIYKKSKNFYHAKDLTNIFYTKSEYPVKYNRIKKDEINKDDKELFNLEFKAKDTKDNLNKKNIKEIFYNNGLHLYDINDDKMNDLILEKKLEAKLRKKIDNNDFESKYNKVIKLLEKKGIIVDKVKISNKKGYQNKLIVKKKRKGTPGTILYDNRFHKDENTKINTGTNLNFKRKSKILMPQYDINYKNIVKYKDKCFKNKTKMK